MELNEPEICEQLRHLTDMVNDQGERLVRMDVKQNSYDKSISLIGERLNSIDSMMSAFADRQASSDKSRAATIETQSAISKRQMELTKRHLKTDEALDDLRREVHKVVDNNEATMAQVNVNTAQLTELTAYIAPLREDMQPVIEGVHAIRESVRVLEWLANIIKWISATVIGAGLILFSWVEYFKDLFKGN